MAEVIQSKRDCVLMPNVRSDSGWKEMTDKEFKMYAAKKSLNSVRLN